METLQEANLIRIQKLLTVTFRYYWSWASQPAAACQLRPLVLLAAIFHSLVLLHSRLEFVAPPTQLLRIKRPVTLVRSLPCPGAAREVSSQTLHAATLQQVF